MKTRLPLFWAAIAGLIAFVFASSVIAGAPGIDGRLEAANRGQLGLLADFDSPKLRGFDYARFRKLDDPQLAQLCTLVVRRSPDAPIDDPRLLAGPIELPPGRYEARLWPEGGHPPAGEAVVMLRRPFLPIVRADGPFRNPIAFSFAVDWDAVVFIGLTDPQTARTVRRIDLAPLEIVPASRRPDVVVRHVDAISGRPGAFILYADDNTFAEGGVYWTRATNQGRVYVVPAGAHTLRLTLHVGPNAGTVRVVAGERDVSTTLGRGETKPVTVPVPAGARLVAIDVAAPAAFRPSEAEPGSGDRRSLGCQVRIELQ